ncbi:MAG: glycosyltransferase family 4 protein [Thermomicrobiales bacterium]
MRVTLVNHRYMPFRGGSELYVQKLAEWLAANGVDTRVLTTNAFDLEYFWDSRASAVDAPPRESIGGVDVLRLPVRHPPLSRALFPASRRGMGELSRFYGELEPFATIASNLPRVNGLFEALISIPQPDIIIATNLGLEGLALTASRAAQEMGACFVLLPFAHLGDGEDSIARRYVSMPHQRQLVRRADMVVALTRIEARFLIDLGVEASKVMVAGAGVDLPEMAKPDERVPEKRGVDQPMILSIGALARDKGTPDLVEASRMLKRRGFDHRLVLVGPELSAFSSWFERSGAVGCDWIRRAGTVSDVEKESFLDQSDVFVLASRTESFGIVYLEAWSRRIPVVGADVGAVSEVVENERDGLLVPFGEPDAIAEAIERLFRDPLLASRLSAAGFLKTSSAYSWDKVFERIQTGLSDILGMEVAS